MSYEKVKNLKPEEFKRLCGVHPETFSQMTEVVRSRSKIKLKTGRPGKLSLENQLLMTFFRIFKNSKLRLTEDIECLGDKGYQRIHKIHSKSRIPKKKPRGGELSREDKKSNQELAKVRVVGEHINRKLKIFKILSDRYRNRRKRFSLRFNLIAGLYNYELRLPKTEFA
ncbi:transposase family protein [Nostoc sp.]|uniref:transposase family protein n=1 Tax=Nostoc sp. TaxID=1180 RepID=UPI002FF4A5F6